jgi:hypothetical protein
MFDNHFSVLTFCLNILLYAQAPTLKKAAKALESSGVKVGAVDVEPNRGVQGKFPDIKGFPTLKFCPTSNAKKAVNYEGGRDENSIVEFAKQQAKKLGIVLGEPVVSKKFSELYSYMGRSALENKPALLVIGNEKVDGENAPAWIGKLASELRKGETASANDSSKESPEAKTKELLKEAGRITKVEAVKDGISSLIELLNNEGEGSSSKLGPAVVSPAYATDAETMKAFNLVEADLPVIVLASVDRKTAGGSYVIYPNTIPKPNKKGKIDLAPMTKFIQDALPIVNMGPSALSSTEPSQLGGASPLMLPEFPKPPNVLAAEERERKRKERETSIDAIVSDSTLKKYCYELNGKTCALLFLPNGAEAASANPEISELAKKFSKEGFSFAAIDISTAPSNVLEGILGTESLPPTKPMLAVVKSGKRPRVSVVEGDANDMASHLDMVAGGSASFNKVANGLPNWEGGDSDASDDQDRAEDI